MWLQDSIQSLIAHSHSLTDIKTYSIDQFIAFLDAAERLDAADRLKTTSDLGIAIAGALGSDAIQNHIDSLQSIANGE